MPEMDDMDDGGGGAPKFMVLYCSIMILLLAFFITLQSMASEQRPGMFYSGKGSFVRALNSFGLGRFFGSHGLSSSAKVSTRYPMEKKSSKSDSQSYPSDPEKHNARKKLEKMKEKLQDDSQKSEWGGSLFAPSHEEALPQKLNGKQKRFFVSFTEGALPALFAQNSLIGVGACYPSSKEETEEVSIRALKLAREARKVILNNVDSDMVSMAEKRVYSFCRPIGEEDTSGKIRVFLEAAELKKVNKENQAK